MNVRLNRFLIVLAATAGFATQLFAQQIVVKQDAGGVIISWESLRCKIENAEGLSRATLSSQYAAHNFTLGFPLADNLHFLLAVPDESEQSVLLNAASTKSLGKIKLASVEFDAAKSKQAYSGRSLQPTASIRYVGSRRGAPLAEVIVQPFSYNSLTTELSYIESGVVNIRFSKQIIPQTAAISNVDIPFFADVVNPSQLILTSDKKNNKSAEKKLAFNDWYNEDQTYLKLYTTRDGAAMFTGADIIAAYPEWRSKPTAQLELLHQGHSYAMAVIDDDGALTAADTFYFAGRRTIGDTTYYDYITDREPFFLTLDSQMSANRLKPMQQVDAKEIIKAVDINLHIEEDHDFNWGALVGSPGNSSYNSENFSFGKGFIWKMLLTEDYNNTLRCVVPLLPFSASDNNLTVNVKYYTYSANSGSSVDYRVKLNANGGQIVSQDASAFDYYYLSGNISSSLLLSGANTLSIVNERVRAQGQSALGVDYFTITGSVRPLAVKGNADFSVPRRFTSSQLSVPGFTSSKVIALDTLSGNYAAIRAASGTFLAAGASATGDCSATANDSTVINADGGLVIVAALPDGSRLARIFKTRIDTAANFLKTLPDGTGISAAFRSPDQFPASVKVFFVDQGASVDIPNGGAWACILLKNAVGSLREKISASAASVDSFYQNSNGRSFRANLSLASGEAMPLLMTDESTIERAALSLVHKSSLRSKPADADVIIVTHPDFEQAANHLAAYRRSQGYSVATANTDDIYNEFSFGKKTPDAIKRYLQFLSSKRNRPPAYLILFGDASWDPLHLLPNSNQIDFVPSHGFPVSDFWYGSLNDEKQYDVIVGRLPVHSAVDANYIVDKLIEYDTLSARPWMRNFFFLSGGDGAGQQEEFYNIFDYARETILEPPVCIDSVRIRRNSDGAVDQFLATTVRNEVNKGAAWLNFWGHGAPEVFDVDGWQVNTLINRGRYNVLATFACQTGAFANPFSECRNEGYVLAKDKGSIAAFGNTGTGVVDIDKFVNYNLFQSLQRGTRRLGDLLYAAKGRLGFNPEYRVAQQQYSLIGDPLTRFVLDSIPDLYINDDDVHIEALDGSPFIKETDSSATLRIVIRNVGTYLDTVASVRVLHRYNGRTDTLETTVQYMCALMSVEFNLKTDKKPGRHEIIIEINTEKSVVEGKRGVNSYRTAFDVLTGGVQPLDPLPLWNVTASNPTFRFARPENPAELRYECELWNKEMTALLASDSAVATNNSIKVHEAFIEWKPSETSLQIDEEYILRTRTVNVETSNPSAWLYIPFYASSEKLTDKATVRQYLSSSWKYADMNNLHYSDDEDGVILSTKKVPIVSISRNGYDNTKFRYGRIIVGGREYIEHTDMASFSIVHLTPFDSIGKFRDYWGFAPPEWEAARMGNTDAIVRYLRDSVANGDIVVISVCDAGFRGFAIAQPGKDGDTASFLAAMRSYGAVLTDSILLGKYYPNGSPIDEHRLASGYVMVGVKGGAIGSAHEMWGARPDSLVLFDTLVYYEKKGAAVSPIFGPAKQWSLAHIDLSLPDSSCFANIQLMGRKSNLGQDDILAEIHSSADLLLDTISATEYPYLYFTTDFERSQPHVSPILKEWNISFTPAPEFALLSNATIVPEKVLRGDTATYSFTVKNIARRSISNAAVLAVKMQPLTGLGIMQEAQLAIPPLAPDEEIKISNSISTDEASNVNGIYGVADPSGSSDELYKFNNNRYLQLRVVEDSIPPYVEVFADSVSIANGDVVAPETHFDIIVHDNSRLPIDSANLRVRLNRFLQPDTNTSNVSFSHINNGTTARARLSFLSRKTLEIGDNLLTVIAQDATANRDTLRLTLNVVLNGSVSEISIVPHPINSIGKIRYRYKGQMQDAPVTVNIFNQQGRKIRTLSSVARIGMNEIAWDGSDENGDNVPTGVYIFALDIKADTYIKPQTGRLIIIR